MESSNANRIGMDDDELAHWFWENGFDSDRLKKISDKIEKLQALFDPEAKPIQIDNNDYSKLGLPTFQTLKEFIQISETKYQMIKDIYTKFGDFDFLKCKTDHLEHTEEFYQIFGEGSYHSKWIYIGQLISEESRKAQGIGILIMQSGQLEAGTWVNDRLDGYSRIIYRAGRSYEGYMKQSRLNGYGKLTHPDGTTEIGYFYKDKFFGEGRASKENKVEYYKADGQNKSTY